MTPKGGTADPRKVPTAGTPNVARSSGGSSSIAASSRYTPPVPAKVKGPSPVWVPILLFGLLIVGAADHHAELHERAPAGSAQNLYLLLGLGSILGGIMVATQYR